MTDMSISGLFEQIAILVLAPVFANVFLYDLTCDGIVSSKSKASKITIP